MHLLVDIGVMYTTFATAKEGKIEQSFQLLTDRVKTIDEYRLYLKELLDGPYDQVLISSVKPTLTHNFVRYFDEMGSLVKLIGPGIKTGVNIRTQNPKEVGSDLICAAANFKDEESVIVVDLDTISSFMYMEKGAILGVNIFPGIQLQMESLQTVGEQLYAADLFPPATNLGTDTVTALQVGIVKGQALRVDGFIDEIKKPNTKVVLTGWNVHTVGPLLKHEFIHDKRLILKGMELIYQKNL